MAEISIKVHNENDAHVLRVLAASLASNDNYARQIRDFAETVEDDHAPAGLQFVPRPGQIVACHFGIAFRQPENVKTRPVLVISARRKDQVGLVTVVPISSVEPTPAEKHHYELPSGIIPLPKYPRAWIKGDMPVAVGLHRLDRLKIGFRQYVSPQVPSEVLREARCCVLHALGIGGLTQHYR